MVWTRPDLETPWFHEGYKENGMNPNFFSEHSNKLLQENTVIEYELFESEDRYELTRIAKLENTEKLEKAKQYFEQQFPGIFEVELEYNLTHGIFCDPTRCGLSVNNNPPEFQFSDLSNLNLSQ
jgi:hypothetical protein